jgi:hypothetical protein
MKTCIFREDNKGHKGGGGAPPPMWKTIAVTLIIRWLSLMTALLQLDQMTLEEKLRAMEALWDDLCQNEDQIQSPSWHEEVLREREKRVQSGQETFIDWETAKKELRHRLT